MDTPQGASAVLALLVVTGCQIIAGIEDRSSTNAAGTAGQAGTAAGTSGAGTGGGGAGSSAGGRGGSAGSAGNTGGAPGGTGGAMGGAAVGGEAGVDNGGEGNAAGEGGNDTGGEGSVAGSGGAAAGVGGSAAGSSGAGTSGSAGDTGSGGDAGAAGEDGEGGQPGIVRPPSSTWAVWRMPNPDGLGLPNTHSYTPDNLTVTDEVTGLMWQRGAGSAATYPDAVTACEMSTLGGFDDWRLPTRIELVSLVDFTRSDPAIDPRFEAASDAYWTVSRWIDIEQPKSSDAVYIVQFNWGFTSVAASTAKSPPNYTRCVR